MKVLMTTMQLDIGGAETHIVELSKALARRGIDVSVASNGGAYEAELTDAGIRHFKVPFHSKNPSAMFKSYNRLKQIILKNNFDVVHAHARIPAFLCGLLKKQINFRFVTTAHWVFSTKFPYNILTKWGDRSLSVSDDIKLYLVDNYGINPSNIRVTINGIDTSKFSKSTDYSDVAREFDLKPNMTRIVYVSRMDVDRSYAAHKLIDIAADLNSQIKDLEILIVGGGNDYTNIVNEAEAVNKDLGRRLIITTGSRTDINKFIASGDIFVGVSRAALEAMAAEVPSIIAGNEGYIGIFDEDKLQVSIDTNFCCRGMGETTSEQLKRDILTLLTATADERSRLGKYSLETINNHYSINTMADDAMKMYVSIIKNSDINLVSNDEFDDIDNFITPLYNGKRKTDVMISGYYGFNNSGDDSILRAIVDSLLEIKPDIDIIALSKNPTETESIYGIKSIHRFNVFRIFWRLLHTKLLISGGGSLIQDITSDKSLAYYLGIINIAKLAGAKVMLYANGIGPIQNASNYKKINHALNRVDLITLRENSSLDELKKAGVTQPKIEVTADPAFNLTPATEPIVSKILEQAGLKKGSKFFGIAIRTWKANDKKFEERIAEIADYTKEKYGLEPLFIPMQVAKDTEISKSVISKIKGSGYIIKSSPTPSEILGIVKAAEFILGMRLHTLIYAVKVGTPAIGLIYDPKVKAMTDYIGQNYTIPVDNINTELLKTYIDQLIKNHDEISTEITALSVSAKQKADENAKYAIELLNEND